MPYANGTIAEVFNDHVTHDTPEAYMYDIQAQNVSPAEVVAAAPGWVRFIEDSHAEPTAQNNYVWIEHPYPFCPVDPERDNWPGKPHDYDETCIPCEDDFCNEWTTYAHMTQDSVRGDAGLGEGDWVSAGDFLGYEDDVGEASTVHLHWHVAVIPPDTEPTFNGYYHDYVVESGEKPEVIPVVCHQGGQTVLWRTGTYTAAPCPARSLAPVRTFLDRELAPHTPLDRILQEVGHIADEGIAIAIANPTVMLRTRQLMSRLEPDFQDLMHLGGARISPEELGMILKLLGVYESRGSAELARVLGSLRMQLRNPAERAKLGILVEAPFAGLD
jgi:murein DD-endopeptidase MepM/ murein hydrolase activator NlpD